MDNLGSVGIVEPVLSDAFADDESFDVHLPLHLRMKSIVHFTPLSVAQHAARLLAPVSGTRVLDVGSGPGKFCLTAARECPGSHFVGVEFRGKLVTVATNLAQQLGLSNVEFVHANAFDLDWAKFDSFYFFNPFAEQLYGGFLFIDHSIAFDPASYVTYVLAVRRRLAAARIGTRVVTYHGFGGAAPAGYDLRSEQVFGSDRVELWQKTRETYDYELDDDYRGAV
ncbi:MAG: methyltransferase domain-containing protein [Kofleriaceae bacterium]|nr:methyltransferase domain-containing protein [Kofleriaceae bacterium]